MRNKNKQIKTASLIIGIFFCQVAYSQVNYQPGVVIKNDGDTLKGFIDYRNWSATPDRINFKLNADDHPTLYKPTDLLEFRVKDEIYVSGIIQTEVSPVKADKLDDDPQPKIKMDTTFLLTLVKGDKSLYFFKNSEEVMNFYIKQDPGFELLVYKRYIKPDKGIRNISDKGKRTIKENKKYIGQLNIYLKDCPSIGTKTKGLTYKQNSLTNLFNHYYKCSSSEVFYKKEREKVEGEIGLLAGTSLTNLEFTSIGRFNEYLTKANYGLSANFTTGAYLDLILPRHQGKWSINNEILFSGYEVSGKVEDIDNENSWKITSTEIGYSYLKMNNMLRYKYPVGRTFWFVNAGISNGIVLKETNFKKEEVKFYSREEVTESRAIEETRKYEQGYILGTGFKYKALSLEMRFENGLGMSKYEGLKASPDRYFLLLGYRFTAKKK